MKREERTAITINKIIELGIEEFGTKGYEGASLNRICEQGIPKGLLYHNFKNKDAVYIACVEKCYKDLTNALKELGKVAVCKAICRLDYIFLINILTNQILFLKQC